MVNKVILIGNLGRDPEVRHLESGVAVARFSVATNESYQDKSGEWQTITEWHDVVVWRSLAERAERQLRKGSLVYVEGKLTHRKWQDREGGDRYSTEVVANTFRSLERRERTESNQFPPGNSAYANLGPSSSSEPALATETPTSSGGAKEDDLPF